MLRFKFYIVWLWLSCSVLVSAHDHYNAGENIHVALRTIGHEFLLAIGDSTSRVLPIEEHPEQSFQIKFNTEFSFVPDVLIPITDSIVSKSEIASAYLVEVKTCDSGKVVHSYRVNENDDDFLPCQGRLLPMGCYTIWFHIVTPGLLSPFGNESLSSESPNEVNSKSEATYTSKLLYIALAGLLIILVLLFRKIRKPVKSDTGIIYIGNYRYDPKNMTLEKEDERQDLTGKESDLLHLLCQHLNATIDKEVILQEVWRDEGDYIGRTLDVYISKLRKKFESDPAIKIINVRGVGYKMTLSQT